MLAELDNLRKQGVLVMSDKDFRLASLMAEQQPEALESVVDAIERIMGEPGWSREHKLLLTVDKVESKNEVAHPLQRLDLRASFG